MVDVSTFEDPIDVKLAMLLHLPGRCVGRRSRIRSMCRSSFEDPVDVNFIIMLLYKCTRITPRVCTSVLFIIIVNTWNNCSAQADCCYSVVYVIQIFASTEIF